MIPALVTKLLRRDDLTADEAAQAMDVVMRGEAHPAQLAGLLVGLAMKGERPAELVGLARTMRARGVPIDAGSEAVDTCGTGGDRSGTFNISTAAAIVVAGAGVRVVKHGNRSVSSHCGSADVLEALGVTVTAPPAVVQRAVTEAGIGFCFAPTFHPAMRHAAEARKALGVPTAFNLLGPLTNPAQVRFQVVGVARPELTELMARALQQLGARRAWVVHGADGLDELSTTGYTKVSECHGQDVRTFYVHPADVGLVKASPQALLGATRGGERPHHPRGAGGADRCAPRRRAAQRRRRAVRRRPGRLAQGGHRHRRGSHRRRTRRAHAGRPGRRSRGARHDRGVSRPARGHPGGHPARSPGPPGAGAVQGARAAGLAGRGAARRRLRSRAAGTGPGEPHRRVQAAVALTRRAARRLRPGRRRRWRTNGAARPRCRC